MLVALLIVLIAVGLLLHQTVLRPAGQPVRGIPGGTEHANGRGARDAQRVPGPSPAVPSASGRCGAAAALVDETGQHAEADTAGDHRRRADQQEGGTGGAGLRQLAALGLLLRLAGRVSDLLLALAGLLDRLAALVVGAGAGGVATGGVATGAVPPVWPPVLASPPVVLPDSPPVVSSPPVVLPVATGGLVTAGRAAGATGGLVTAVVLPDRPPVVSSPPVVPPV